MPPVIFVFWFLLSRALYFTAYSQAKQLYNRVFPYESAAVHLASAVTAGDTISIIISLDFFLNFTLSVGAAGIATTTATSPIWVVKTQIQLDTRWVDHSKHYYSCVELERDGKC